MPASITGPTTDEWWRAGSRYIRTGATRGTTNASGLFLVSTGFPRVALYYEASDEASHFRNADGSRTMSTFYLFNMASIDPTTPATARFRTLVFKNSSDMNASFTLAASTTGVTARWIAFGY